MSDATAPFRSGQDETPPEVPDFDLIRPIGQGGFGRVWLAANRTTGHLRAVKVIPLRQRGATDPAGREITSITRLEANVRRQHPNLLNIHHVGQTAAHSSIGHLDKAPSAQRFLDHEMARAHLAKLIHHLPDPVQRSSVLNEMEYIGLMQ